MAAVVGRIRKRSSFRALARPQGRAVRGPVSVSYVQVEADAGIPLVAYAVGRRVGPAVVRNRVRRRLREAVRASASALPPGSYLVHVSPQAASVGFNELGSALRTAAIGAAARARRTETVAEVRA